MRTITLSEKDANNLWQVLTDLLNDKTEDSYIAFGKSKHWEKHAFVGEPAQRVLLNACNQLTESKQEAK